MIVEPLEKYLKHNAEKYYAIRKVIPDGIIAGGAARQIFLGEDFGSTDVDFYFPSKNDFLETRDYLRYDRNMLEYFLSSSAAIGFLVEDIKCQLIKTNYSNVVDYIFADFDLTCCCFAIKDDEIYYYDFAAKDAIDKKMIFMNTSNQDKLCKRVGKYMKKGYCPGCPVALKVLNEFIQYVETRIIYTYNPQFTIEKLFRSFFGNYAEDY